MIRQVHACAGETAACPGASTPHTHTHLLTSTSLHITADQPVTVSIHDSLHAVFRVGKPQYDLLRFDFQVCLWRDRRIPDRRRRCRRRRLLLLSVLREPAPGEQPDGAERRAGDVQLPLRRRGCSQPELRQLLPLQHRPIRDLLHPGGLTSASFGAKGGMGAQGDRLDGFCLSIYITLQIFACLRVSNAAPIRVFVSTEASIKVFIVQSNVSL